MWQFIGGTFLIIGGMIGGGILSIPIVSAQFGFASTFVLLIVLWALMLKTGLYVLSLSLSCPQHYNSYYSIVGKFLGDKVQKLTVFLYLWLLYFSLSADISGCVATIMSFVKMPWSYFSSSILFVLIFGSFLVVSAKLIVRLNVVLVLAKLGLLILAMTAVYSYQSVAPKHDWFLVPNLNIPLVMVLVNAFGYQFIIPSLVSYYGKSNPASLKWMIIISTTFVLSLYIAWLYTMYLILPMAGDHGLQAIYQSSNQLLALNESIMFYMHSKTVLHFLSLFEVVAMFGSFFCISLGVFDFLKDVFKTKNRLIVGFGCFVPPLMLLLFSQNMYVYAMSAAGYVSVVIEIIIPTLAAIQMSRKFQVETDLMQHYGSVL